MSTKTPGELFGDWLTKRAAATRLAITVDSDRLLSESGVLGQPTIRDEGGREWEIAVFRGDDLAFRSRFRKAAACGPTVVVITRGEGVNDPLDVSRIGDLLSRNEGGPPLDLSLNAYFRRLCPQINFPAGELERYRRVLMECRDRVPAAAKKIVERWGRPDDWGRGQVGAMILLARHPALQLADVWCDEIDETAFIAHAVRLLAARPDLGDDVELIRDVLAAAAQPQVKSQLFWVRLPPSELAAYLVLRLFADGAALQNPTTQLAGLHILPVGMPLVEMDETGLRVATLLSQDASAWAAIQKRAQPLLGPRAIDRLVGLLPSDARRPSDLGWTAGAAPWVLNRVLRLALQDFFGTPDPGALVWLNEFDPLAADERSEHGDGAGWELDALVRLARQIREIEAALDSAPPAFPHADALLDWYLATGHHRLELAVARSFELLQRLDDRELLQAGAEYLFGGEDDLAPGAGSLKGRVRARLDALDTALASFVAVDPAGFARAPRSALGLIQRRLSDIAREIQTGTRKARIWILLFDGLRYDIWEESVRPLLAEHFAIESEGLFAVPPTYTAIARTSLFAGALPADWRGYRNKPTSDEATLLARQLGFIQSEARERVRLQTGADTGRARLALGIAPGSAADINVLIYPIADDCHDYRDDLVAFAARIRNDVVGDASRRAGILTDLLARIEPDDVVLVTSDHGFVELLKGREVVVTRAEAVGAGRSADDDVKCRFVKGFHPASYPTAVEIPWPECHFLAVGSGWFRKETARTAPRYEHGGVSLAEMVVPAAVLRRMSGKRALLDLDVHPDEELVIQEDETAELRVVLRNGGNVAAQFQVRATTNLGEPVLSEAGGLQPAESLECRGTVVGRYREDASREADLTRSVTAVTVRLRHTDTDGKWRDADAATRTLKVVVKPKLTKLTADALKGFDDV